MAADNDFAPFFRPVRQAEGQAFKFASTGRQTGVNNTAVVTINGTPTEDEVLTAVAGTWTGSPTLTYQWYRDGVAIGSATDDEYTLVTADVDAVITVTETANALITVTSAATEAVAAAE